MRTVQIYIENQRVDLFNDEQIVVNSSVQNISDLAKVFTDFSQTFTIPCSDTNNYIFEHYYNNDVDNTIDHNRRRAARIEIDHTPFKSGKCQLEKSDVKKGHAESYTVTFYGEVVTLKDILAEDKLTDLNYSTLNHTYSGSEIQSRITTDYTSTDYNVRYPLISSSRVWQYDSGDDRDISDNTYPIDYTELFPAVRVKSLLDIIESQYSVNFTGTFLDTKRFRHLYMWYKNKESYTYYTAGKALRFGESNTDADILYNGTVQYSYTPPITLYSAPFDNAINIKHKTEVEILTGSAIDYYLDVYDNGEYLLSLEGNGTQEFVALNEFNYIGLERNLTFQLRSQSAMTFSCVVTYTLSYTKLDFGGTNVNVEDVLSETSPVSMTTVVTTDLAYLAPDMKLTDMLAGVFNMFNLTVYGEDSTTFRIEPLDTFYNSGLDYDVTKYVDIDSITYNRPKLYNVISFEWEQSQSFMNREFYDLFRREYGNLRAVFGYDGGDYTIKLPFETLLHSQFADTNIQVGYCLGTEPEYKNYVPKPVMLYMYDKIDDAVSFYFDNGTTTDQITGYMPFGQDVFFNDDEYSLNWGSEISSITEEVEVRSLYQTYYQGYLLNLFNGKTRLVNVKMKLPISVLTKLKLKDSLIIRDKKYIINEMKSNLNTGEVDFTLLSNWRDALDFNRTYTIPASAYNLLVPYSIPDDVTITIGACIESPQFATPDDTTLEGEQSVTFTCTANTGAARTNTFPLTVTVSGVTLPTQYIIINQIQERNWRVLETNNAFGFAQFRLTENGGNRIIE